METKTLKTALISVFDKNGIEPVLRKLSELNIKLISTGGTYDFIRNLGIDAIPVEKITGYPSILNGRVKTLHPKIFGGILGRTDNKNDNYDFEKYDLTSIDLVIVDLYPFEQTLKQTSDEQELIEKIDIGGISLIRAAAKNYNDVLVIPSKEYYDDLLLILKNGAATTKSQRKYFASKAFAVSSHYDTMIYNYFSEDDFETLRLSHNTKRPLRYGENPHQKGVFFGNFDEIFEQISGKQISYNNLLDISAAVDLIAEFDELTLAILKHNNACGLASRPTLLQAWKDALAGDPISAFGGIIITNTTIDELTAKQIDKIFYEVVIAPNFSSEALKILSAKKKRIILKQKLKLKSQKQIRSVLNGWLVQEKDNICLTRKDFKTVTKRPPTDKEIEDLLFANKIVKHTKSNAIVLAKDKQLVASGVGQTSRVDALKQAIEKAQRFNLPLKNAVMASDAFFPFADSVEIAYKAGIRAVIQPGGSIRDNDSIEFCDKHNMTMIFTGIRHFKH